MHTLANKLASVALCWFLIVGTVCGQDVIMPQTSKLHGSTEFGATVSETVSVSVNLGGTISALNTLFYDSGNQDEASCSPFTTPTGTITVASMGAIIGTGGTGQNGFAIYADSAGSPGALVSGSSFISGSASYVAGTTYTNTYSGLTVTAGSKYWACQSGSWTNAGLAGTQDTGATSCPYVGSSYFASISATFPTSWPSTMPAGTAFGGVCEAVWATLSFSSSSPWFINQIGISPNFLESGNYESMFPATGSSHVLVIGAYQRNESVAGVTSFTDSASDTFTNRLGNCDNTASVFAFCVVTADSLSSGVTTFTAISADTGSLHPLFEPVEIQKAGGTPTYDGTGAADTSGQTSSFTGPNVVTTGSSDLLLCFVQNSTLTNQETSSPWTAGSGWTVLGWGQIAGAGGPNNLDGAVFYMITSSAGTYNCTGSYSGTASVYTATVAYK
jgi:hypothetical protein